MISLKPFHNQKPKSPKTHQQQQPKPSTTEIKSLLQCNRKPQLAGENPRVVVITSGKGGVGKTTTAANVGLSLAPASASRTASSTLCRLDQALVRDKRWSNFELLCISKPRSKLPIGLGGKAFIWLVESLKDRQEGSPDFIHIDCPAGIDAGFSTAITPANEAVLVTTPDITSLRDADRVTGLLECDGIRDIKMIVNRVQD